MEHLRYAGDECLSYLVTIINKIIDDVDSLSSPQLNTAIATPIYKGKNKPLMNHKSYRLVRILPLISRIFDELVRPQFIELTQYSQNPSQYGFTEGISYLLAALQRHEVKSFCVDINKIEQHEWTPPTKPTVSGH